jgi:hypothetical protein
MNMQETNREVTFYYDILRFAKTKIISSFIFGILTIIVFSLSNMIQKENTLVILHYIVIILIFITCSYLTEGIISLLFWNLPIARVNDSYLTLYRGAPGFRDEFIIRLKDIDYLDYRKRLIKGGNPSRRFGTDAQMLFEQTVMVIKLKESLAFDERARLIKFCSYGFFDRHFKSDEQGLEIWITKSPREGFEYFQLTIKHVINLMQEKSV